MINLIYFVCTCILHVYYVMYKCTCTCHFKEVQRKNGLIWAIMNFALYFFFFFFGCNTIAIHVYMYISPVPLKVILKSATSAYYKTVHTCTFCTCAWFFKCTVHVQKMYRSNQKFVFRPQRNPH